MSYIQAALKNVYFSKERCNGRCIGLTKKYDLSLHVQGKHFCRVFGVNAPEKRMPIPSIPDMFFHAAFRCQECITTYGQESVR